MPWLTPDSIPEDGVCRPLLIPADSAWLALVSGALTELTKAYNWQQLGTLTVQQTVDEMQAIVDNYYASACASCITPGGYRVTRINSDGHLEQLNDAGAWETPTDDYAIPAPAARTEGTSTDQICLAAKNAVNVLQQLYENLTDSWSAHLSEAEAETALIGGMTAIIGFEFAPITWSIVAFFTAVFGVLYAVLGFVGADLWDEAVSAQITCFLKECATNDAGVVTFDYHCFMGQLNSLTNNFSLTESQLRLYLQITYILYFMGGIDGLNLAGRTTEITDSDCSECACTGTSVDFSVSDHGFVHHAWDTFAAAGVHTTDIWGTGWYAEGTGGFNQIGISGTVAQVCGTGINVNAVRGATPSSATIKVKITTSTQVKNATFTPTGLTVDASVLWDEGGYLLPDSGTVEVGYIGDSGFGIVISSFQTGEI